MAKKTKVRRRDTRYYKLARKAQLVIALWAYMKFLKNKSHASKFLGIGWDALHAILGDEKKINESFNRHKDDFKGF